MTGSTRSETDKKTVLVTGGSGFVGSHAILQLLESGYRVRTTVRSLSCESDVRTKLRAGGVDAGDQLSFVEADLTTDEGWVDAAEGCTYVLHIASPFPSTPPEHEDDVIVPAVEGTQRVLRAARDAGVSRVVMTSSFAAVGYGHSPTDRPFTEEDWTNVNGPDVSAYVKSKTLAERGAWDFIEREGDELELAVINPVGIFGPALGPDLSSSVQIIQQLLDGDMPAVPKISFNVVDVRDVVDLHLRAMTDLEAAGERFLAVAGNPVSMPEIAQTLRTQLGESASQVPKWSLPNWFIRIAAPFVPSLQEMASQLGKTRRASNEKARRVLDWSPRASEDAYLSTAESLTQLEQS